MEKKQRGRPRKHGNNLKIVCVYLENEAIDFLDQYCEKYQLQRSALLRLMIQNFKKSERDIFSSGGIGCEK